MDKTYNVTWSQTALTELANIRAYPPEVKERIFLDSFGRLSYAPTLTARQLTKGFLAGIWVRMGLYQVLLLFTIDERQAVVIIEGIKHKREDFTRSR